jgi:trimeric autotransporter adhesin
MQRVSTVRGLAVVAAILLLIVLPGCGGGSAPSNKVTSLSLSPTSISLNQGAVSQLSAVALDASGSIVAADITFTSSNTSVATVSTGGLICGGEWDANIINCNPVIGQAGVGQVTITATATAFNVSATATVYVHERVDQVQTVIGTSCTTMGQPITISGKAYSTSAPGCSPSAPCDITSTVGPFAFGTNDATIAASSAGIVATYSSTTNTPTYTSGGTITGSTGQTCALSSFSGVTNATATVALTGQNKIASGTQLTITNAGYGATSAPTTALLSNGSATCSGTATVQTEITSGVLTAVAPGATTLFSSVSGVNSVGVQYETCPVASILVHGTGGSGTSFALTVPGTLGLTADVLDSNGQAITPTLSWGSSSTAAATVVQTGGANGATVTAVSGGTANITATCSYPTCNKGLPAQYGQNVAVVSVIPSVNTTVYAASSNSKLLVPISTATDTVSASITLPDYPNSLVADPAGRAVYLGSASGLMAIATGGTTVTTFAVDGTILAISPDGQFLLISDDVNNQVQYFSITGGVVVNTQTSVTANSSAYTPDAKFNVWVNATELGVGYPTGFLAALPAQVCNGSTCTPYTPSYMDIIAQGGLFFVSSATSHDVYAYATCNQSLIQSLVGTAPTLIKAIPNGKGAVAVDPPYLDVIYTPPLAAGCTTLTTQSVLTPYDLGVGSFTPTQLLVTTDSNNAWILSNLSNLVDFNLTSLSPSTVSVAGGATPLYGGLSLDGTQLWVGTSDNTVHRIDTALPSDVAQVAVNLTDANGNVTPPNLVCVVP